MNHSMIDERPSCKRFIKNSRLSFHQNTLETVVESRNLFPASKPVCMKSFLSVCLSVCVSVTLTLDEPPRAHVDPVGLVLANHSFSPSPRGGAKGTTLRRFTPKQLVMGLFFTYVNVKTMMTTAAGVSEANLQCNSII